MINDIIVLHGAIGSKEQMAPLAKALENKYQVHSFNFSGHGGRPFSPKNFSIELFSHEIFEYIKENNISRPAIFGYSMGGYAAMYLAKYHPDMVSKVLTLATKFHWDEATATKEVKMLDAATIQRKVPDFAAQLQKRHAPNDWKELLEKTNQMLLVLGSRNALQPEDYTSLTTPCLVMLGDRDKMVTLDETVAVYKKLPAAQLAVLPGTPHPLEQVNTDLLVDLIRRFTTS